MSVAFSLPSNSGSRLTGIAHLESLRCKDERLVAGVMSGTSSDAIDVALCTIRGFGVSAAQVKLVHFYSHPYPKHLQSRVKRGGSYLLQELAELDNGIADAIADAVRCCAEAAGVKLEDIDLIGSHGQTIYHHSNIPGAALATLQIGNGDRIAYALGIPTVADFRAKDVAAGGQGAPLTPYTDMILYRRPGNWGVLNLGGIANISAFSNASQVIGFDTGPANAPLDRLAARFSAGSLHCDVDGNIARAGVLNRSLLEQLLREDKYLVQSPPKSTGFEGYGDSFVDHVIQLNGGVLDANLITTITEFVAVSISEALLRFVPFRLDDLVLAGGGCQNLFLKSRLVALLAPTVVRVSDEWGVSAQAREAMAWAILANDALGGERTSLPAVTGAKEAVVLGSFSVP